MQLQYIIIYKSCCFMLHVDTLQEYEIIMYICYNIGEVPWFTKLSECKLESGNEFRENKHKNQGSPRFWDTPQKHGPWINVTCAFLGFACVMLGKKVTTTLSQMVTWWCFTMVQFVKDHQQKHIQDSVKVCDEVKMRVLFGIFHNLHCPYCGSKNRQRYRSRQEIMQC